MQSKWRVQHMIHRSKAGRPHLGLEKRVCSTVKACFPASSNSLAASWPHRSHVSWFITDVIMIHGSKTSTTLSIQFIISFWKLCKSIICNNVMIMWFMINKFSSTHWKVHFEIQGCASFSHRPASCWHACNEPTISPSRCTAITVHPSWAPQRWRRTS